MAKRGSAPTYNSIHPDVQKSFKALEDRLKKENRFYTLHFTSQLDLFPDIQFPELCIGNRFETSKRVREPNGPQAFSEGIHALLENKGFNPKTIAFSLVPHDPITSIEDMRIVKSLCDEIGAWHFQDPYRHLSITLRSNLVKEKLFHEYAQKTYSKDQRYFKKLFTDLGFDSIQLQKKRRVLPPIYDGYLYFNEHVAKKGSQSIEISNRIIASKTHGMDKDRFLRMQSFYYTPRRVKDLAFAIAPRGVMFNHTSLAINNPIMWISHQDFQESLQNGFPLKKMVHELLRENAVIYEFFQEKRKPDELVHMDDYPLILEIIREVAYPRT